MRPKDFLEQQISVIILSMQFRLKHPIMFHSYD